jgi:fructose-bisphosphate aldolase class II
LAAACRALADESAAEIAIHLDHVDDPALFRQTLDAGFSSVMFDAGALPYAANVTATREAAQWAHEQGLWLEAELGYVGGKPDAPASAHAPGARTDPAEATEYVRATGVDALAVAVGSSHAMTSRTAALDVALIERLHEAVPVPLVLHGSSGVPDDELRAGIRAGLTKINVGTALNVAFTGAVRARLTKDADVVDPRRYLRDARDAVTSAATELLHTIAG